MENKTHLINTFEQILNVVNSENKERFASDFFLFICAYADGIEGFKKDNPKTKGMLNTEIAKCTMEWVDDGKAEIKCAKFIISETGEVIIVKKEESNGK